MPAHILIIDDDQHVIDAIRPYLTDAGYTVSEAGTAQSGLAQLRDAKPSLVLLDVRLPDASGFDLCKQIRAESMTPIIMLTALGDPIDRVVGLELGADDYVAKPFVPREIIARVEAVLRRSTAAHIGMHDPTARETNEPLRVGELEVDLAAREIRVAGTPVKVTPTEFDLLSALARAPGLAFSKRDLMSGSTAINTEETLDKHMLNLRRKIEPDSAHPRYILPIRGFGYKIVKDPSPN